MAEKWKRFVKDASEVEQWRLQITEWSEDASLVQFNAISKIVPEQISVEEQG